MTNYIDDKDIQQDFTECLELLITMSYNNALEKGFHPEAQDRNAPPLNVAEKLMLIVTELAEACEQDRKGDERSKRKMTQGNFEGVMTLLKQGNTGAFEVSWKDTFIDEIADTFIRLFDLVGAMNIDVNALARQITAKMCYNSMRENKHGKRY